ncbi:PH domain containing protein [Brugia malayi]|uniref:PH domain containing protein n=1 Tax=Brugia malayi TaxID=6279 RepID=A0A4E9FA29_BRUMA|nr:PH domain containing protein [Brugia malayi]VIO93008.1 PH domain containing protein [Brugia malayi]
MGRRRGRDFGYGGYDWRYNNYGYVGDSRRGRGNCREVKNICRAPVGQYPETAENTVVYECIKSSSEMQKNEPKIPCAINNDFAENDAKELEIVSATNTTNTETTDELTNPVTQDIELGSEKDFNGNTILLSRDKSNVVRESCIVDRRLYLCPQRNETSLRVRSELDLLDPLRNVGKSDSAKTKGTNADPSDPSWSSCFELHLNGDESQNSNVSRPKTTSTSLEVLHNGENSVLNVTRTLSISGQKLASVSDEHFYIELSDDVDEVNNKGDINRLISVSKKDLCNNGLYDETHRTSDNCLDAVCGEVSANSRFVTRWRSFSFSAQNCNHTEIFTTSKDKNNAIDIGKAKILLTAQGYQKTPLCQSRDCISLTDRSSSNFTFSSAHSNKSFTDSFPWGDVTSSVESHISTPRNSDVATKDNTSMDASLPYMMLPDTDHISGCNFNRTQISREEYVKDKTNVEQKAKVELPKDELKKHCFVTQHTIIYPVSHLEMQCFPNSTYQFKYEEKDEKSVDKQAVTLRRDQCSQTKELVVTQSPEDTNRAVSVLNTMLERRLNNSGSQNGSFTQERLNSFYSTPLGCPKSPPQKISNFQSFTVTNRLHDLVDRSDAPLPHSKCLSVGPEMDKKTATIVNEQYEHIVKEPKEILLKQYCQENSSEKASPISGSEGRSTIRNRLPRGQTRKLASLFETMSDAASVEMLREMDHLKRRGKSVPPNIIKKTCHQETEVNTRELFRDLAVPLKTNEIEGHFIKDEQVVEARNVRSIVNRFESVSDPNKCQNPPRTIQIDTTPRKLKNQKRYSQSPSSRSDEWNECSGHGSSSHNLPYGSTSCANVWDQQQYELGLRRGITNLKRYDSRYNRVTNEILSQDPSYAMQTQMRQMNYNPEVQSSCRMDVITDRSQKHIYEERLDNEIVDHVAEVEKAFDFVNKTDSLATLGQQCSQESLAKPLSPSAKTNSISLYRDLEREYRKLPNNDIPVGFSPAAYSSTPSAGERLATYEYKNQTIKTTKLGGHMVSSNPMATSTPLDGSPATNSRTHTSASYMLNRSGFSSIAASTAHEIVQLQQSDIELQTIKQEIMIQEGQIAQASLALTHCKRNNSFNGTLVELSAQRGLLLARERLLALRNEMQRLERRRLIKESVPPVTKRMRGAIDLTSINVYLNRNFCIRNIDENVSYAFVILLKTDEQVEATQTVTLMDTRALRVSKVHFSDQIRFTNLPVDFTVLLEIYALKVTENRRSDDYSCSMLKNKAKSLLSPSKKTCGDESVVGFSEFTCCGHICLNRDTIGIQKFYLDGAVYPLEGTIEIDSRCTTLPPTIEIDFRGFLTMYQVISGLGSWARYWAVLRCGVVQFWKYPDDEASEKPPLACMDLSKCTDKEISHASHEICSRPNAFTVDLLVPTTPSLIEKKRVLLSADTKELCSAWLNALNGTLEVLRG